MLLIGFGVDNYLFSMPKWPFSWLIFYRWIYGYILLNYINIWIMNVIIKIKLPKESGVKLAGKVVLNNTNKKEKMSRRRSLIRCNIYVINFFKNLYWVLMYIMCRLSFICCTVSYVIPNNLHIADMSYIELKWANRNDKRITEMITYSFKVRYVQLRSKLRKNTKGAKFTLFCLLNLLDLQVCITCYERHLSQCHSRLNVKIPLGKVSVVSLISNNYNDNGFSNIRFSIFFRWHSCTT